jgi:thiol:disulfide interchange protein
MKNLNKLILVGLSVAMIATSCSIEKRVHNSGYHITWNKVKHQADGEKIETASNEVKEHKNKNFVNLEKESVASNEKSKENAVQANLEVAKVEQISNELSQTSVLTKESKKNSIAIESTSALNSQSSKVKQGTESKVIKAAMKKMEKSSKAPMSKSDRELLILILLWVFLGGFAAHRWYAGKPIGWNILFILTAGGCGVWAIIDLINIIRGEFN